MAISKIIVAFAAASLVSTAAYAGLSGSPLHGGNTLQPARTLKTKDQAFVTGNGQSTALPQSIYTPIDAGTVLKCKSVCIASAEVTAQMNTGGADWIICIEVDGVNIECNFQGVQSGPNGFVIGNATANTSVGAGSHTFQTLLWTQSASASYQYFAMHYAVNQ